MRDTFVAYGCTDADAAICADVLISSDPCFQRFVFCQYRNKMLDAARLDAEVLTLAQRIECVHDERSLYPVAFSGGVKVSLRDGSELEHFEAGNRGAEGQLLSHDQVRDKFLDNCALTISAEAAERLWQTMMTLDELNNVSELTALLREEANSAA